MTHKRGFTLIEIVVAIGLITLIASIGLVVSMEYLRGRSAHSEEDVIVSLLQNARSQSLSNIDQVRHGVHFVSSPLRYIEFECPSSLPQCTAYTSSSADSVINSSYNVSIPSPALPFDIIFGQLSGDCVNCASTTDITVNDGARDYVVSVNNEGQIDWK